ncbi:MAG: hypothetical protein AAF696_33670 [Bacteroidota bacterium]
MNKLTLFLISLLACTFLPSCLTIEESYKFNKNGSGWMQYKISTDDLAQMMEKFSSFEQSLTDETEDRKFDPEKLSMRNLVPGLEKIEGLSAINLIDEPENNMYGLNFKFKSLNALNKAMNHILNKEGSPAFTYFSMDDNVIRRSHKMSKNRIGGDFLEKAEDSDKIGPILSRMKYDIKYNFKQEIRVAYSEAQTTIMGKKSKDLHVESNLRAILENEGFINTSIVFK